MPTPQQVGQIRAHQSNTNYHAQTLGANLPSPADLKEKFRETAKFSHTESCMIDYRRRLKVIIKFWIKEWY